MNLAAILAFLGPFASLLDPALLNIEAEAMIELKGLIAEDVQNPTLKALLTALANGVDEFAKLEIGKL